MPPAELDLPATVDADLRTDVDVGRGRQQGNDVEKIHYAVTAFDRSVELLGEVAHSDPGSGERDQPRLDGVRWHVPGDVRRRENGQCRTKAVAGDQDLIAAGHRCGQMGGDVVADELVDLLKAGMHLPEPADRTVVVGYRVDIGDPLCEIGVSITASAWMRLVWLYPAGRAAALPPITV
jgi:hypothetical protein